MALLTLGDTHRGTIANIESYVSFDIFINIFIYMFIYIFIDIFLDIFIYMFRIRQDFDVVDTDLWLPTR